MPLSSSEQQNSKNACDLVRAKLAAISLSNDTNAEGKNSLIISFFGQFKYAILLSTHAGVISRFEAYYTPYSRPNCSCVRSPDNHCQVLVPSFSLVPAPPLHEKIRYPQSGSWESHLRPHMNAPATAPWLAHSKSTEYKLFRFQYFIFHSKSYGASHSISQPFI